MIYVNFSTQCLPHSKYTCLMLWLKIIIWALSDEMTIPYENSFAHRFLRFSPAGLHF